MGEEVGNNVVDEDIDAEEEDDKEPVLPVSYERAEETIIGLMIQDDDMAAHIMKSGLCSHHFRKPKNKKLFDEIFRARLAHGALDYTIACQVAEQKIVVGDLTLLDYIGGKEYITDCMNEPHTVTSIDYADSFINTIINQWKLAEAKRAAKWILDQSQFKVDELISRVSAVQLIAASDVVGKSTFTDFGKGITSAYDRYLDRSTNPDKYRGISTGFFYLDKHRVISPGRTTTLGARTSIGKSIFVMNWVGNMVLNGWYVGWFSPELDTNEIIDRMVCAEARIPIDDWKEATLSNAMFQDFINYRQKVYNQASDKLFINDAGVQTVDDILNSVKIRMLSSPVDVIVVDYLQKLKYEGSDLRKSITDAVSKFYAFAKDNNVATILVSQLKRTKEQYPQLSDLKESGDIENFSDNVILLHRDSVTHPTDRQKAYYELPKNRVGQALPPCRLRFLDYCLKFIEEDLPTDISGDSIKDYDISEGMDGSSEG